MATVEKLSIALTMTVVRRTARAKDDLVDVWLYIAADHPDAADRLLEEIDRKCVPLAGTGAPKHMRDNPDAGPGRLPDQALRLRMLELARGL